MRNLHFESSLHYSIFIVNFNLFSSKFNLSGKIMTLESNFYLSVNPNLVSKNDGVVDTVYINKRFF